jgi:hypothetical protein
MVAAGVIESKRFMHASEWSYYLEKNCVEIEKPMAGAVGRLFIEGEVEVHGFIHLDDETIFAKHGEDQDHGYRVMSYEDMLTQYGRTRLCRTSNLREPHCYHSLQYYSCEKSQLFSAPLKRINAAFEQLSFSSETKLIHKDDCLSPSFKARQDQFDIIKEALLEISSSDDRDRVLENILSASYRHQLYNIEVSGRNYRCKDRKLKYGKLKEIKYLLKSTFTAE